MGTLGSTDIPAGNGVVAPDALAKPRPRHFLLVRTTHWISALCIFALLVTGAEITLSHPRFYWGETGNVNTKPLFKIPVPPSPKLFPTVHTYVLPDPTYSNPPLH